MKCPSEFGMVGEVPCPIFHCELEEGHDEPMCQETLIVGDEKVGRVYWPSVLGLRRAAARSSG